jgi:Alpha galactosidase A C-terminal beta sandwich domain
MPAGSYAFAFVNLGTATPTTVSALLTDFGLRNPAGYNVTEVFDGTFIGVLKPDSRLKISVNPSGVFFGRAEILK